MHDNVIDSQQRQGPYYMHDELTAYRYDSAYHLTLVYRPNSRYRTQIMSLSAAELQKLIGAEAARQACKKTLIDWQRYTTEKLSCDWQRACTKTGCDW